MAELTAIVNPTQNQVIQAQQQAIERARKLATDIEGVNSVEGAQIREILPDQDLEDGGDNNWNGTDRLWTQTGMTADQENTTYDIDSQVNAQNKALVFYGFANVADDPATTALVFEDTTGAQFAEFNTQLLEIAEVSDFYVLEEPITYGPTADGSIVQEPTAAADNMVLLAKVAEPLGNTLTVRNGQ